MSYVTNNQIVNMMWEKFPFIIGTKTKMFGSPHNKNSSELNKSEYFFAERCKRRFKSGEKYQVHRWEN